MNEKLLIELCEKISEARKWAIFCAKEARYFKKEYLKWNSKWKMASNREKELKDAINVALGGLYNVKTHDENDQITLETAINVLEITLND